MVKSTKTKTKEGLITTVKVVPKALDKATITSELDRAGQQCINNYFEQISWRYIQSEVSEQLSSNGSATYTGNVLFLKAQSRQFDELTYDKQLEQLTDRFFSIGRPLGWRSLTDDEDEADQAEIIKSVHMPDDIREHMSHIYNLDAQIRIIQDSIRGAIRSGFWKRHHCLLYGQPGCGKTETLLAFEKIIGSTKVVKLDATATTKAGAENLILELKPVPPIIIIEELEKCNPVNLPWLLGILDKRGEIIKTTGRKGYMRKEARCLCLGTVNNVDEFRNIMSGALASRFQHQIYFPRPTYAIMKQILEREIKEIEGGKMEWIEPALRQCIQFEACNDPRRAIAILDGGDRLLTEEYQKDLLAIRLAKKIDDQGVPIMEDGREPAQATNV